MNFNEYSFESVKTAVYDQKYSVIYPVLGLNGEIAELVTKIRENDEDFESQEYSHIAKEIGDVFWYVAAIARDLNISLSEPKNYISGGKPVDLSLYMIEYAGIVDETVKKVLRDKEGIFDEVARTKIGLYLSYILDKLASIAGIFGYTIEAVLQMNIDKLRSRQQRGVLSGSGDNR